MAMIKYIGKWFIASGSFIAIMYSMLKFLVLITSFSI